MRSLPPVAAARSSLSAATTMEKCERISQWVASQEIPSDLTIRVGDSVFPLHKVARTVDEVAAEIATEAALPVSKFVGVAGAVPKDGRDQHDLVYRAVDIYLKTHPGLDEIEREKVCSVMDPLRLSHQARLHASQNNRLPLQVVLSALYYDNLKIRSQRSAAAVADDEDWDKHQARENEALRSELAQMRAYLSGMQGHSKGSASSRASSLPGSGKKASSFLGSVSRTLSRLNPFNGRWAKDTSTIVDGRNGKTTRDHVVKPKRRRFSIG